MALSGARQLPRHASIWQRLSAGPPPWNALRKLRIQSPISTLDVAAFVLQENIGFQLEPYRSIGSARLLGEEPDSRKGLYL